MYREHYHLRNGEVIVSSLDDDGFDRIQRIISNYLSSYSVISVITDTGSCVIPVSFIDYVDIVEVKESTEGMIP
jgi:hypothetical protein